MSEMHAANRSYWNSTASFWKDLRDLDQRWRNILEQPELAFDGQTFELIRHSIGDLRGKRACVIGSGDNYAVFALAGLGAQVTSIDIAEQQLRVAAGRAEQLGLEITFIQSDAADLEPLADEQYDLVCSTNGFFVWISQPAQVFQSIYRVLKPGGWYFTYDLHPFQRPWKDQVNPLEMEKPYTATGPFECEDSWGLAYEFNWRISDIINPMLESGLLLHRLVESPPKDAAFWVGPSYVPDADERLLDWRSNPRAGLPAWLTLAAQKPSKAPGCSNPFFTE